MPTNDPIAAARREAKARVRKGGTTHQQALDAIAREAGHANWAAMAAAPTDPVLAFVDRLRPHGGIPLDETTRVLTYDAIHGYLGEPEGTDIAAYVDAYDFRGDDGDISPNAFQRDIIENAIEAYAREHAGPDADAPARGPNAPLSFQMDEVPYLTPEGPKYPFAAAPIVAKGAPTLADVERETLRLMKRQDAEGGGGMKIGEWISARMREAAGRALKDAPPPLTGLAQIPMTTDNVAYAMDPMRGPYEDSASVTIRCPLHGDPERHPSLVVSGMRMACMAGCDGAALESKLVERLAEAAGRARAFMARNDRSEVVEGSSNSSKGGMGGTYVLADGTRHRLDTLTCRLLPTGYPRWEHGSP